MKKKIFFRLVVLTLTSQLAFLGSSALQFARAEETATDTSVIGDSSSSVTGDAVLPTPTDTPAEVMNFEIPSTQTTEGTVLPTPTPVLTTDKPDYFPGQIAAIVGSFFEKLQTIALKIFGGTQEEGTYTETNTQVTTDEQGSFTFNYQLDNFFRPLYTVIGSNLLSQELARTTFTDAIPVDFKQCANNNGTAGICDWIGSILQNSNSVYFEGMSVPQRILYRGIPNGSHTITFNYSYTKAGIHAYDFLTSLNQGNEDFMPGITEVNYCQGLGGADTTACNALAPSTGRISVPIPHDPYDSKDSAPAPGNGTSQITKENAYETANGVRNFEVKTNGSFTAGSIVITHDVTANADTGDSFSQVLFSFTLSGCPNNSCNFILYFDGHLAVGGSDNTTGVNWGVGLGSSNINGGPYHVKDLKLDGNGGSQDNQIKGSNVLVPPGSITLDKVTDPSGSSQSFNFTTTNLPAPTTPSLTDVSDLQVWSSLVNGTTYTITETVPSGWSLTGRNCTGASTSVVTNITNGVSIALAAGDNIVCIFTNTLQTGHIIVDKVTNPSGDSQSFAFTTTGTGYTGFSLTDAAAPNDQTLNAGTYSVAETVPSGWDLTPATCSDQSPINAISLQAGETVT